jgi:murein DD-endopeptidase MepM/ murein hydrolase activator NlpD
MSIALHVGGKVKRLLVVLLFAVGFGLNAIKFRAIEKIQANGANVTLKVYQSSDDSIVEFRVVNKDASEYNVEITMNLDNMQSNKPLPFKGVIPANSTEELTLFRINRVEEGKPFFFRDLNWRLTTGPALPAETEPVVHNGTYVLPWPKGMTFRIDNAFNGYGAHQGDWAYGTDFGMPEGTTVCAARSGVVVAVVTKFSEGGDDPSRGDKANYIYIRHDDGSIGRYLHIRKNGALVKVNQKVSAGQPIAYSGNVGWSTGAHLHFDVIVPKEGGGYRTVPFQFKSRQGKLIDPVVGLELEN